MFAMFVVMCCVTPSGPAVASSSGRFFVFDGRFPAFKGPQQPLGPPPIY
jgi:hypothetical protein